ncbi:unnamed protein product, partial [Staurois parvus]
MRHCSGNVFSLTLPCAPTMCPLQRPGHLLRPMPASGFCSCPCDVGTYGRRGKFKNFKKCHFFFFFHFTHALSCALPAFCLFFL